LAFSTSDQNPRKYRPNGAHGGHGVLADYARRGKQAGHDGFLGQVRHGGCHILKGHAKHAREALEVKSGMETT